MRESPDPGQNRRPVRMVMPRLWLAAITGVMLISVTAEAGTISVTNTKDSLAGSLRQSIQEASVDDTIVFQIPTTDPGYNPATNVFTITLTSDELTIGKNLTIDGGSARIVVQHDPSAALKYRVFHVTNGVVTLSRLTNAKGSPAGNTEGGGIYNSATLTITNCLLTGNALATNTNTEGGAVYNAAGATLTVSNSTIQGNIAAFGSAVYNAGTLTLNNTTVTGNNANNDAAVLNQN